MCNQAGREIMIDEKFKKSMAVLAGEFIRYCFVGGVAFLADYAALWLTKEYVFGSFLCGLYLATGAGFLIGLVVNYVLSLKFVFTQAKDAKSGRTFGAFAVFGIVGLVGLALTELGMWVGVVLAGLHYMVVKLVVTVIVLMWNYLGRKLFIFNAKEIA